jgi:heat shock protein HtpX
LSDLFSLAVLIGGFNILQWLLAPYLIDMMYRVKEISRSAMPRLYDIVERLSAKSGIGMPRIMLADIPIPNAFAYGSPVAGTRIAVTKGLLDTLDEDHVEAVIGHELGHIKHRDVQVMMFASVLPAIFYYIGFSLMYSARSGDRERTSGTAALGLASMVIYGALTLLSLRLSRLREFYADRHSVDIVENGRRKLSEALARIVTSTSRFSRFRRTSSYSSLRGLFITDPEKATQDAAQLAGNDPRLVQEIMARRLTAFDSFVELFSTHPNIVKRLRALQEY